MKGQTRCRTISILFTFLLVILIYFIYFNNQYINTYRFDPKTFKFTSAQTFSKTQQQSNTISNDKISERSLSSTIETRLRPSPPKQTTTMSTSTSTTTTKTTTIAAVLASPPPPPPPLPTPLHYYASIFQQLCQWKFKGTVEKGNNRCCQFNAMQRKILVKAMAPFVALKPAAPIQISKPPFYVSNHLNCNTNRWGGKNLFTGAIRTSIPLVIDIFIVAAEMDLLEARMYELAESVDYFLVGISPKNHRGDPQPNWFEHARDVQNRFPIDILEKIIVVDVTHCHSHKNAQKDQKQKLNSGNEWSHQLTHRDCLWEHGITALKKELEESRDLVNTIPDDTIFIFTDVDELPSRELIYHMKHCNLQPNTLPAHLKMRVGGHNFRVPCSNGAYKHTGASEIAEWKTIKEDGGVIYRFGAPKGVVIRNRRKGAINDAGIHLTWYGSMAFVDYKGFTHAEGGYFTPMWSTDPTQPIEGNYCLAENKDQNHVMSQRQKMANEKPLKFVRFWERHESKPLPSVLQYVLNQNDTSKLYQCHMPWVAVENPERFIWFWGEGKAEQIDRLADFSVLDNIEF